MLSKLSRRTLRPAGLEEANPERKRELLTALNPPTRLEEQLRQEIPSSLLGPHPLGDRLWSFWARGENWDALGFFQRWFADEPGGREALSPLERADAYRWLLDFAHRPDAPEGLAQRVFEFFKQTAARWPEERDLLPQGRFNLHESEAVVLRRGLSQILAYVERARLRKERRFALQFIFGEEAQHQSRLSGERLTRSGILPELMKVRRNSPNGLIKLQLVSQTWAKGLKILPEMGPRDSIPVGEALRLFEEGRRFLDVKEVSIPLPSGGRVGISADNPKLLEEQIRRVGGPHGLVRLWKHRWLLYVGYAPPPDGPAAGLEEGEIGVSGRDVSDGAEAGTVPSQTLSLPKRRLPTLSGGSTENPSHSSFGKMHMLTQNSTTSPDAAATLTAHGNGLKKANRIPSDIHQIFSEINKNGSAGLEELQRNMGDPSSSPEAVVKEGQLLLRDLGVLMDHGGLRTAELTRLRRKIEAVVKDPGREKRLDKVWEQVVDGWQILADALQAEMEALASDTLVLKRELSLDLRGQAERQLPTILPARTEQAQEKLRHLRALLDEAWKLQGSARRRYAQGARRRVSPKASTAMTNFYYRTPRRPAAGLEEERLQLLDWEWWKEPADRRKKVVVELGGVKAETELIRLRANTTLWLLGDPMRAATRLQVPLVLLPDRVLELTITLGAERAVLDMPFASQPGDRKKAIPYPAKGKPPVRVGLGRQPSVEDYPLHRVQIDPDDRNVSRSHLELVVTYDRSVGLRDSSSKNGTWVPVTFLKEFGAQPPEVLLSKALQGYVAAWNAYQPYLTEPVGSLVGPTRTAFETLERMMKRAEQGLKVVLADQFGSDQEAERWLRREEDARRRFPDGYSPTVETLLDAIAGMSQDGSAAGLEEEFREKVMALKQYGEIRRFLWSYWARGQGGDPIPLLMAWRREPARWKLQLLPGQAIEVFHWMLGFLESFPPDRPDYRKELFAFFRGTASDQDSWGSVRTAALHGMRLVGPTDEDEREILEVADALWKETLIWSHRKGAARGVIQSSLIRTASHLRVPEARSWLLQKKNERALRRAAGPSTAGQRPVVRPPSAEAAGLEELPLARLNELDRFLYETTAQFAAPRAILADAAEDPRVAQLALALSLMMAKDGLYEVEFRLVIQESYASGLVERLARVNRKAAEEYLLPRIVSFDGRTRTYADAQAQALEVLARRFGYESAQHLQQSGVLRPVRILTERLALDLKAFLETGGLLKFTDEAFERFQALLEAA